MFKLYRLIAIIPFLSLTVFCQEAAVSQNTDDCVYVAAFRTPNHVKYSDPATFNLMVDEIMALLNVGRVAIMKDPERKMIRTDEEMSLSSLLNIAKIAGARYLLHITINRPFSKWVEVTLKCYETDGTLLWDEKASEGGGMSGKNAPVKTREKLRKLLESHLGKPGLPVEGSILH